MTIRLRPWICGLALACSASPAALAQQAGGQWQPKVEIHWNRYYTYSELLQHMQTLQQAYPNYIDLVEIGESFEGRPLRVMILTDKATGNHTAKPAMWVDGNVHGNEVQGSEAILYLAWWLLEHRDDNPRAQALLRDRTFYLLPSVNPDGRDRWFATAGTPHSSRTGVEPTDNDRDGVADEDPMDDLDGDGEILTMRKKVPLGQGTHRLDQDDARILVPVRGDQLGDYLVLGQEGIDNDNDGRINEDGVGGYDMNRNWPSDWQPNHVQYGAGDFPLCYPETAAVARFLYEHPNVAAVQSFHNSGGMLLRGPGDEGISYPRGDISVYDKLGEEGELILPFYRYLIIHKDLYNVHGGFVTWTYEGLGIFSFTNELWASNQYWGEQREPSGERRSSRTRQALEFNDSVLLGEAFVDWRPFEHPTYGSIEIGGFKRQHGRVAPSFMIEEMLHRNALFCLRHAEEIAEITIETPEITDLGGGLYRVVVDLSNASVMPSRSRMAADNRIGLPDTLTIGGEGLQVLAGGLLDDRFRPETMEANTVRPETIRLERGVPGQGRLTAAWLVRGKGAIQLEYRAQKAAPRSWSGSLR